jgi:hypothetical protein
MVIVQRQTDLADVLMQALRCAACRAALIAGSNKATRMPMMAITTSNSTRVNPRFPACLDITTSWKKEK